MLAAAAEAELHSVIPTYPTQKQVKLHKLQWAFGPQGINLQSSSLTGRGVRVAVFDTSPIRIRLPFWWRIGIALPTPMWFTGWDAAGTTTVSNHGLFVAGLIHRIAPNSRIQLIQVLNDNGCGELWALDRALEDYTSRISFWSGNLNKTVINMSLGFQKVDTLNHDDFDTLHLAIDDAHDRGAIIVAAAGNDSYDTTKPVQEMRYPAKYDNVIGVAAANMTGQKSCFSNKGDVAAPGGNSGVDPHDSTNPCAPRSDTWNTGPNPCNKNDPANCPYILISLAQTRYGPQYVYWSGTSFSTPLVSGLAALSFEKIGSNTDQVECLIRQGKPLIPVPTNDLGAGLINVDHSLNMNATQCLPPP